MRSQLKLAVLALYCASAFGQSESPSATALSPAAMQAAVETLRQDPNLRDSKKLRSLHWVKDDTPAPKDAPAWIVSLFSFLAQSASVVVWAAGATGLAVASVWIYRIVRSRQSAAQPAAAPSASRVQHLDIDPSSLPEDVGAAALTLLHAGRTREALSLLYRGALSRAVHRFAIAIGESFTEGEALRAVGQHLDQTRVQYFASLVAMWQRVVYAAEVPASEAVATLCLQFAPTFDAAATA